MDRESLLMMKYFIVNYLKDLDGSAVLDIGSARIEGNDQPEETYRDLFKKRFNYFGMDLTAGDNVDVVGYENIKCGFDVVVSGQVMEHVNRPWDWLKNLVQYSKRFICIVAPWKFPEHKYPIDTYRYLPAGMRDLFNFAGIKELEIFKKEQHTIGIGEVYGC